jgi:hypothetical protein
MRNVNVNDTYERKIEDIKRLVLKKCTERIERGERYSERGTLPGLKRKWL